MPESTWISTWIIDADIHLNPRGIHLKARGYPRRLFTWKSAWIFSTGIRWEAKIDSVKAIRYQISSIHDALVSLFELEENHDPNIAHEANTLLEQLKDFNFLVSIVVWFDVLFHINIVSKSMLNKKIDITLCANLVKECLNFF